MSPGRMYRNCFLRNEAYQGAWKYGMEEWSRPLPFTKRCTGKRDICLSGSPLRTLLNNPSLL